MNGLETEFAGEINFVKLNVGRPENARIQQEYEMRGHPSAVILDRDGQVVQRYFGEETAETLRAMLNGLAP